jgi:aminopeptidase-like protein
MHARTVADIILLRTHVLTYADGQHSIQDMAELFGLPVEEVREVVQELAEHDLLVKLPGLRAS